MVLLYRVHARRATFMRTSRVEQCKGVFDPRDYLNKMRRCVRDASFESFLSSTARWPPGLWPGEGNAAGGAGRNNLSKEGTSVSSTRRTTSAPVAKLCAEACRTRRRFSSPLEGEVRGFMRLDGRADLEDRRCCCSLSPRSADSDARR